ncbi:MAG: glycoside hydrolase family 38, partial [Patescibacteria group bacterium]|nr:glycoside hydrolase family 38 [Patescibacteria group bacterium]
EKLEAVKRLIQERKLSIGPWYVLPDEWLISGESLIRNLQKGAALAGELGTHASPAGFVCDEFGHTSQMPQIFDQMGIRTGFVWRGTQEKESKGHFNWTAPDGTILPTYRFGKVGYCSYVFAVRDPTGTTPPTLNEMVDRLVKYVLYEANRSPVKPILLFDGGDHMEIEPQTSTMIERANKILEPQGIKIIHSNFENYCSDLLNESGKIQKTMTGELRESARDPSAEDEQWLIPGTLSSRIHLKQKNAVCEDELSLWAEPFSAFAVSLGCVYPEGYLRTAWKHLLENHPHDSMCGCSIDQVHQDMIYRFDQSLGISSRLTMQALKQIGLAAAPRELPDSSLILAIFNATAETINEQVDLDIPLPTTWPKRFQEFFGFEEKFAFKLINAHGEEVPYQLVGQARDREGATRERYHFPRSSTNHLINVSLPLNIPAFGYTTLIVKPVEGPTRYLGSMATSHRAIENEFLRVEAAPNGTILVTDKRTGVQYKDLLTFENRADIGDGWYHGIAVNDQIFFSSACAADIAMISDGIAKATMRISVTMNVPKQFDFKNMVRDEQTSPLKIVSDVTLRKGAERIEVTTIIDNTILDHRIRVLFPTNLSGETYLSDAAFDVVERPVALLSDNNIRRELDVETRPHITWTAFGDGKNGLAVVSRGLPESAVINTPERPIALTLFRAFRRAVFSNDNPGGQIQGLQTFKYDIVPYAQRVPTKKLFLLGQQVNQPLRMVTLSDSEIRKSNITGTLSREYSFLKVAGNAVVTSVQHEKNGLLVRLFNPLDTMEKAIIKPVNKFDNAKSVRLDGREDLKSKLFVNGESIEVDIPPKRICTVLIN